MSAKPKVVINPDLIPKVEMDSFCRTFLEIGRELFKKPAVRAKYRAYLIEKYGYIPEEERGNV